MGTNGKGAPSRAPQIFANYSFKSLYLKQKYAIMLHFYIMSNYYCIYPLENSVFTTLHSTENVKWLG